MSHKTMINEKPSTAYIMNAYTNDLKDLNDLKFYMHIDYQMAKTMVMKCANEKLEDASMSAAIQSCINLGNTFITQLNLNPEEKKSRSDLIERVRTLRIDFDKLFKGHQVSDNAKSQMLHRCNELIHIATKKFGDFGVRFDRRATAVID
jgi:hypothetical protein